MRRAMPERYIYIMVKRLFSLLFHNKLELLLSICMFSNLYPSFLPNAAYYAAFVGIGFTALRCHAASTVRTLPTLALMGVILLSTFHSGGINARSLTMCFLLFVTMAWSSEEYFHFKYRFLFISLLLYAFTSVINCYAKFAGINFYETVQSNIWGSSSGEFSGLTCHPMWLSAACGIGTIFFVYAMVVRYKRGDTYAAAAMGLASLASLWTAMQGGSRSASGIAILCSLFLILVSFEDGAKKKKLLVPILFIGVLTIPLMATGNEQFKRKQGGLSLYDDNGETSRTALWKARIDEFQSEPALGIGFGKHKGGYEGSTETGSGWLTALAQTGIAGFALVCFLVYRTRLSLAELKVDSTVALFQSVMLFLLLHSLFEAYMFQIGWYMCLFFWLLASTLDDYKTYGTIPDMEGDLFGEEDDEEEEESVTV